MTFKHAGRTYGMECIFSASEARAETYNAFGQEKTFLGKLLKLGFVVSGDDVYHPEHWEPIPKEERRGATHRFRVPGTPIIHQGRAQALDRRRR